ncbi:bifunctional hydroxymethylpyrimidine kinase/phosphomethylpyrimidine kinase [Aeromicrobium sp. UC242_57]|uniref:bifunctional hydroxymethylpyrimidine kinase/phosphomethylpyrimidine kinase n=1 Tax=Aeromicrobium sp. UC242_57 TaxID=3374624 RepID=UPI00378C1904
MPEAEVLAGRDISVLDDLDVVGRVLLESARSTCWSRADICPAISASTSSCRTTPCNVWRFPRVDTVHTHGTGCTLSSAIASHLVLGRSVADAVAGAKDYLTRALVAGMSLDIGSGHGPVDHRIGR